MLYVNWHAGQPDNCAGVQSYLHFWGESPGWDDAGGPYASSEVDHYLGFVLEYVLE